MGFLSEFEQGGRRGETVTPQKWYPPFSTADLPVRWPTAKSKWEVTTYVKEYFFFKMPFIRKKGAFRLLESMKKGKCVGSCRKDWLRNIGYALKSRTNPLNLTKSEHKKLANKIKDVKKRKK